MIIVDGKVVCELCDKEIPEADRFDPHLCLGRNYVGHCTERYDLELWIGHPLEGAAYLPR